MQYLHGVITVAMTSLKLNSLKPGIYFLHIINNNTGVYIKFEIHIIVPPPS